MADHRTYLTGLVVCNLFLLPVVMSLAMSSISVPYDAPVGYKIATIDSTGETLRIRHVDDTTRVFKLSKGGVLSLKHPLKTLLHKGRTGVMVVVQHGHGTDGEWEELINVHITGVDNRLHLTENSCLATVEENSPVGTIVKGLETLALWRGDAQIIKVQLSGEGSELFNIEVSSEDGHIRMYTTEILDREELSSVNLHLFISGERPNTETTEATISVTIRDQNDNAPEFFQVESECSISVASAVGTKVTHVYAVDRDEGNNAELSYRLLSNTPYFGVDSHTGVVYLKQQLPESGVYDLFLGVDDNGDPMLTAEVAAHISVVVLPSPAVLVASKSDNINLFDDMVVFKKLRSKRAISADLTIEVNENTPLGTVIGSVKDFPAPTDRFSTNSTNFDVDELTGNISTTQGLDFEVKSTHDVDVTITNILDSDISEVVVVRVVVVDVSEPPFWTKFLPFVAVVTRDAPGNAEVYRLQADDVDANADLRYYLRTGDGFYIDEFSGAVLTEPGFVYMADDAPYILSVYAEDVNSMPKDDETSLINGQVKVFVDSHPPQFVEDPYETSVPENTPTVMFLTVQAVSFANVKVTYSLLDLPPNTPSHTIDPNTGEVTLRERVDREELSMYYLEIQAQEVGGEERTTVVRVNVEVEDSNDNAPQFEQAAYSFDNVPEDIGLDQEIGSVKAIDPDAGENGMVYYTLTGEDASFFRVDEEGTLYPNKRLDYDLRYESYFFTVMATDGNRDDPRTSMASVRVRVTPESDETPVFNPSSYTYYVDETANADYSIGTVYASDADGERITFTLEENSNDRFRVEPGTGVIKLTTFGSQNLPDTEYRIVVVATDSAGRRETTNVRIIVNDVNDHAPIFVDCESYSARVVENVPVVAGVDTFVLQVNATDADRGLNAELTYRLVWSGDGENPFVIDRETGVITLAFSPDRELQPSYRVTAIARDKARDPSVGLCSFTIEIDDVNDSRPQFRRTEYSVSIPVSAGIGESVVTVEAEDADLNSVIFYEWEDNKFFRLNANTGEVIVRGSLRELADQTFEQVITANDSVRFSYETLTIRIVDSTDKAPVFINPIKEYRIKENASTIEGENILGVYVAEIQGAAPGGDTRVKYSLLQGARPETNSNKEFNLNNYADFSGAYIFVQESLDYESVQQIELTVLAEGVVGSFPAQETVTIYLEDVNDNPPQFPVSDFDATVEENSPEGTSVATVVAEDADKSERFRKIRYSIDQSSVNLDWQNFEINEDTGEILTTTDKFDRESVKTYLINVIAENVEPIAEGTNLPNRAQTTVRIDILDINDNLPRFERPSYTATVQEDAAIGDRVTVVTATDDDIDSTLRYLITNGNTNGVFEVDPDTGRISVAVGLDYESVQNYTLEYSANDGLNSEATTVYIQVIDVNDNRPVFDQFLYNRRVEEHNSNNIPGELLTVNAVDGDSSASPVVYSLQGSGANTIFTINRVTGVISINEELDREKQAVYNLIAVAQDDNGRGLTGYATVVVTVIDINDWAPRFPEVEYVGSVPENSPIGTSVMDVIAEDMDDPDTPNGRLTYRIVPNPGDPNDGSDEFAIDPDTGEVTTRVGDLDAEGDQDMYTITVEATDGTFTAITTASVTISDVNDHRPEFNPRTYREDVPETLPLGDTAVEVMATDGDLGLLDEVFFEIVSGDDDGVFGIYTDTPTLRGLIYPVKVLDFEIAPSVYTLTVRVNDGQFTDTATVTIRLTDENEPPVFDMPTYTATVREDISPGTTIKTVNAVDPDGTSPNNQFRYSVDPESDPDGLFVMSNNNLQLATGKNLDRETVPTHTIKILATDFATPPLSGSATVEIILTDVDDTAPRFAENYVGHVRENTTGVQWVAVVSAVDDDLTPVRQTFQFNINDNQPGKEFFAGLDNSGNNSYTIETRPSAFIDREETPRFDLAINITDERGNTGPSVLPIEVEDINDNPHFPVTKTMTVYAFEGSVPPSGAVPSIGIGYVGVRDLDSLEDKTYTIEEGESQYVEIDSDTGLVQITEGTPATESKGPYEFKVRVSDGPKYPDVISTVIIDIIEVPREAVFKSGSLRLSGMTPEEFISPGRNGGPSPRDKLRKLLSQITGAKEENIDIFTVLPVEGNENAVDVRYSAHGSPYYSAERLNGAAESDIDMIESTLGVTVDAIYIDECATAECDDDCSNVLAIDSNPVVINSPTASLVGINAYVAPFCGCAAREADVGTCVDHYCYNNGTCEDTFSGPVCTCAKGFSGPDCQGTTRSFGGNDYAHLPALQQCSQTRTSLEFITEQGSGILFYNGPTSNSGPQDYILLQLRAGKPLLNMDLGSGDLTLEVSNSPQLNDGKWHKIDIFRNRNEVELVIDDCRTSSVMEDHTESRVTDLESCSVTGALDMESGLGFDVTQPLQLGGVKKGLTYPSTLGLGSARGFNGCIRNLDQDSKLYDLHDVDEATANSQPGCPAADRHCADLNPPCVNGVCDADFSGAVCICNPGWTGRGCNQELDAYDFLEGSYVKYQLRSGLDLLPRESHYKIMVRTRKSTGRIWEITNSNTYEHVTMELTNGTLTASWHLGDDTISITLDKYPLDNGEWHHIFLYRYDNYVQVKVDGGGGVRQAENRDSTFRELLVDRDNLIVGAELEYGVNIISDFVGCVKDPRINDKYLGVIESTDYAIPTVTNVNKGCPTDACANSMCAPPLVCVDIWRAFECRCMAGLLFTNGRCLDIQDCASSPCENGGTCNDLYGDYECVCPKGYAGKNCELLRKPVVLTIGASGILPIIGCLLLLLLLLLLFFVYTRTKDKKQALAFAVDPEDDIRENFIDYDEEGGEEDETAYDLSTLRKPVHRSPVVARPVKPLEEVPRRAIPRDGVNVGDYLEERLGDTDHDPSAPPYDTLHTYDYEGEGSTAGSLSSLNSSSSDGSQDYDYLNDLGPPFKKLADMYGGGGEQ